MNSPEHSTEMIDRLNQRVLDCNRQIQEIANEFYEQTIQPVEQKYGLKFVSAMDHCFFSDNKTLDTINDDDVRIFFDCLGDEEFDAENSHKIEMYEELNDIFVVLNHAPDNRGEDPFYLWFQ